MTAVLPAVVGLAIVGYAVVTLRFRHLVVTITGISMEPTYRAGDRVLVRRSPTRHIRRGQVVLIRQATMTPAERAQVQQLDSSVAHKITDEELLMIKRVAAVPGDPVPRERAPALRNVSEVDVPPGFFVVLGDHAGLSYDSAQYGYLPAERVIGVVRWRITSTPRVATNSAYGRRARVVRFMP